MPKRATKTEKRIAAAHRDLTKLRDLVEHVDAELVAKRAELAAADDSAASTVLEARLAGDTTGLNEAATRVAVLRAEVEIAERAVAEARDRRSDAHRQVLRAEAAALREEATAVRAKADKHEARTRELLEEAARHEEVDEYVAKYSEPKGVPIDPIKSKPSTRTQRIRAQADELDRKADKLEHADPDASITAEAPSVEGLMVYLVSWGVAPVEKDVQEWADRVSDSDEIRSWIDELAGATRAGSPVPPLMFRLVARGVEIDEAKSSVGVNPFAWEHFCRQMAPKVSGDRFAAEPPPFDGSIAQVLDRYRSAAERKAHMDNLDDRAREEAKKTRDALEAFDLQKRAEERARETPRVPLEGAPPQYPTIMGYSAPPELTEAERELLR